MNEGDAIRGSGSSENLSFSQIRARFENKTGDSDGRQVSDKTKSPTPEQQKIGSIQQRAQAYANKTEANVQVLGHKIIHKNKIGKDLAEARIIRDENSGKPLKYQAQNGKVYHLKTDKGGGHYHIVNKQRRYVPGERPGQDASAQGARRTENLGGQVLHGRAPASFEGMELEPLQPPLQGRVTDSPSVETLKEMAQGISTADVQRLLGKAPANPSTQAKEAPARIPNDMTIIPVLGSRVAKHESLGPSATKIDSLRASKEADSVTLNASNEMLEVDDFDMPIGEGRVIDDREAVEQRAEAPKAMVLREFVGDSGLIDSETSSEQIEDMGRAIAAALPKTKVSAEQFQTQIYVAKQSNDPQLVALATAAEAAAKDYGLIEEPKTLGAMQAASPAPQGLANMSAGQVARSLAAVPQGLAGERFAGRMADALKVGATNAMASVEPQAILNGDAHALRPLENHQSMVELKITQESKGASTRQLRNMARFYSKVALQCVNKGDFASAEAVFNAIKKFPEAAQGGGASRGHRTRMQDLDARLGKVNSQRQAFDASSAAGKIPGKSMLENERNRTEENPVYKEGAFQADSVKIMGSVRAAILDQALACRDKRSDASQHALTNELLSADQNFLIAAHKASSYDERQDEELDTLLGVQRGTKPLFNALRSYAEANDLGEAFRIVDAFVDFDAQKGSASSVKHIIRELAPLMGAEPKWQEALNLIDAAEKDGAKIPDKAADLTFGPLKRLANQAFDAVYSAYQDADGAAAMLQDFQDFAASLASPKLALQSEAGAQLSSTLDQIIQNRQLSWLTRMDVPEAMRSTDPATVRAFLADSSQREAVYENAPWDKEEVEGLHQLLQFQAKVASGTATQQDLEQLWTVVQEDGGMTIPNEHRSPDLWMPMMRDLGAELN